MLAHFLREYLIHENNLVIFYGFLNYNNFIMINILVKTAIKKLALKLATDKNLRDKVKTGVANAHELNTKGELIKSLGKAAGRIKRKLK